MVLESPMDCEITLVGLAEHLLRRFIVLEPKKELFNYMINYARACQREEVLVSRRLLQRRF